jgi:chromate transporter
VLNLAIWFATHTVFREVRPLRAYGVGFAAAALASMGPWAFALALAAGIAIFRFKVGMIPVLAACSAAGILLYLPGAMA